MWYLFRFSHFFIYHSFNNAIFLLLPLPFLLFLYIVIHSFIHFYLFLFPLLTPFAFKNLLTLSFLMLTYSFSLSPPLPLYSLICHFLFSFVSNYVLILLFIAPPLSSFVSSTHHSLAFFQLFLRLLSFVLLYFLLSPSLRLLRYKR